MAYILLTVSFKKLFLIIRIFNLHFTYIYEVMKSRDKEKKPQEANPL